MELMIKLLVAGGVMGVLDFLWLGFVAKKVYYSQMGSLLLEKPNMALAHNSLGRAAGYGALFGLVAYATYDLTNLAVLKGYSPTIAVIDLAWGMVITAAAASAAYLAVQYWAR